MVPAIQRFRRPVRVLIVADHICYPGNVLHGGTTYFLNTLPRLDPACVELTMCFVASAEPVSERLRATGVEAIYLGRRKWDPRALIDLVRLLRAKDIDVAHLHGMKSILLGRLATVWVGCRVIVHLHDNNPPAAPILLLQRWLMRATDRVVGVSRETADWAVQYLRAPAGRTCALHNGVDLAGLRSSAVGRRQALRSELGVPDAGKVVAVVGRFSPLKRHDRLIKMVGALRDACPLLQLWLIGEGATRQFCEQLAVGLGVASSIRFLGQRGDVPALLAAADILAVPSDREALSFSAIEALAVGTPVVAFASGGIVEVIRDGVTGFLVPPGNERAFADALKRLLLDEDTRRRLCTDPMKDVGRFDIVESMGKLQGLFQEVARSPAQPRLFPRVRRLRASIRKNLPEVMGLLVGGLPKFVWLPYPRGGERGVPVFCYHRASVNALKADLQFLAENNYRTLDGDGLLDHLSGRLLAPPKSVVLTFDDGGKSLYEVAFPLLQQFQQRAIAFVCPGLHSETSDGGLCSWSQIEEMVATNFVEIQSHTLEHRLVSCWPQFVPLAEASSRVADERRGSPLRMEDDFLRARELIERRLGRQVRHIALPMYRGSAAGVRAARKAGYVAIHWGLRAGRGLNASGSSAERISRVSGDFVRRLPGIGRRSLWDILCARWESRYAR